MIRLRGLYAITPAAPCGPLVELVSRAVAGGASMVQYRDKTADADQRLQEARALATLCHPAGVPLIINDDLELAARIGADGIHLGRDDCDPWEARRRLGPAAIIGVSCYADLTRASQARSVGADYVAFGRFFPSRTKPEAVQAHTELLRRARKELDLPLVAIGGITPENARSLIAAGADMVAVVDGVFGQPDVCASARAFTRLFQTEDSDEPIP